MICTGPIRDSLTFLHLLCRRAPALPLAVVATARPWPDPALRAAEQLAAHGLAEIQRLAPLTDQAARDLLRERFGDLNGHAVDRVVAACDGNPLLLELALLDPPAASRGIRYRACVDRITPAATRAWQLLGLTRVGRAQVRRRDCPRPPYSLHSRSAANHPAEALGILAAKPLRYFGTSDIPDQYICRWDGDDGESPRPDDPELTDLSPLRPQWGAASQRTR